MLLLLFYIIYIILRFFCIIYICIMYIMPEVFIFMITFVFSLFILSLLSLYPSTPLPSQLSAGWFLLVSWVLLKVSSC